MLAGPIDRQRKPPRKVESREVVTCAVTTVGRVARDTANTVARRRLIMSSSLEVKGWVRGPAEKIRVESSFR
jgi:hypothetical protein